MANTCFVTHLLFVNDLLILFDGSRRDVAKLNKIIELFCKATGIRINIEKSKVSFYGNSDADKDIMTVLLPYQQLELENGLNYLCFYLKANYYKKKTGSGFC